MWKMTMGEKKMAEGEIFFFFHLEQAQKFKMNFLKLDLLFRLSHASSACSSQDKILKNKTY